MSEIIKLKKIDPSVKYPKAYTSLLRCGEIFSNLTSCIPKTLSGVVTDIHTAYNRAGFHLFKADSEKETIEDRLLHLDEAYDILFYQQNSFEYIVSAHGCTIGQANEVIEQTKKTYELCDRWKNELMRKCDDLGSSRGDGEVTAKTTKILFTDLHRKAVGCRKRQ